MINQLKQDAQTIINESIAAVMPSNAVKKAMYEYKPATGKTYVIAIGKAAWHMAYTVVEVLGKVDDGIVITKYGHINGPIQNITCYEAGHPILDENGISATQKVIDMVSNVTENDNIIFLVSGGGSALFESPLVDYDELQDINRQMLSCGASITEINTIRKRLSAVKGGKFAVMCEPANIFSIILSDILGDPPGMIASGPAYYDDSTCEDALNIVAKYNLSLSKKALALIKTETPKDISNVKTFITGSVKELCNAAYNACIKLGYKPIILTDQLSCEARDAGVFLANIVQSHIDCNEKTAFITGGETVVHIKGNGLGGRNQEIALAAAPYIKKLNACVFSVGSDGTDGPTDAAGGYVDGDTNDDLTSIGISIDEYLNNNDSYHALKAVDGLIITGPTGTNVNDLSVALIVPS